MLLAPQNTQVTQTEQRRNSKINEQKTVRVEISKYPGFQILHRTPGFRRSRVPGRWSRQDAKDRPVLSAFPCCKISLRGREIRLRRMVADFPPLRRAAKPTATFETETSIVLDLPKISLVQPCVST